MMNTLACRTTTPGWDHPPMFRKNKTCSFEIQQLDGHSLLPSDKELRLTGFEIVWITRGNGSLIVDGNKKPVKDNCILFLAPGLWRCLELQPGSECLVIDFSLEFLGLSDVRDDCIVLQDYYGDSLTLSTSGIEQDLLTEMEELKLKMRKEFERYGLSRPDILRGQLKLFLIYFSRNLGRDGKSNIFGKNKGLVKQFLSLVKREYKMKKMVADYADALCLTPSYLNEVVKKVSGFPARYHIQQCIVNEAKNHALLSNLSLKEISYELGFTDHAHFSKFFKNVTGVNFTTFKRDMKR